MEVDVFNSIIKEFWLFFYQVLFCTFCIFFCMSWNARLSLMLRAWRLIFLFNLFIFLQGPCIPPPSRNSFYVVSVTTCCWLNSKDSYKVWNSLWRTSTKDKLTSKLVSCLLICLKCRRNHFQKTKWRLNRMGSLWGGNLSCGCFSQSRNIIV